MPLSSIISPAEVRDYFYRDAVNAWNTLDSGHNWRGSGGGGLVTGNSKYQINANANGGRILIPSNVNTSYTEAVYVDGGVTDTANEVLMKFSLSSVASDFGIMLRRGNNNSFYVCRVSGGNSLSIIVKDSNVAAPSLVQLISYPFDYSANVTYWMRFRTDEDLRLKARIWREDTIEPTVWQLNTTAYTGAQKPGSGYCGIFWRGSSTAVTAHVYAFYGFQNPYYDEPDKVLSDLFVGSAGLGLGENSAGVQWRGSFGEDPSSYAWGNEVSIYKTAGNNYASIDWPTRAKVDNLWGFIGPDKSNTEVVLTTTNQAQGYVSIGQGVRLTPTMTGTLPDATGYYLDFGPATGYLILYKNELSGTSMTTTQLGIYAHNWTLTERRSPKTMRLLAQGNKLYACVYEAGTPQPDWQIAVTDDTFTTGCHGITLKNRAPLVAYAGISQFLVTDATPIGTEWTGEAVFSAETDTAASGQRVQFLASTLSGEATTTVKGSAQRRGFAPFSAASDLTVTPFIQKAPSNASADFSANAFFVRADSRKEVRVSSSLSAESNAVSKASRLLLPSFYFSSESSLVGRLIAIRNGQSLFDANASLFADSFKEKTMGASLSAIATALTATSVTKRAAAALSAEGAVFADANDFRIPLSADGSLVVKTKVTYAAYLNLGAEAALTVSSRIATTQIGEAPLRADASLSVNATRRAAGASTLTAESNALVQTSRTTKATVTLDATANLVIDLVDFAALYDDNLRYRTALLHRVGKQLYPQHTSIMLRHKDTSQSISSSPFVILDGIYAIGYGVATTVWGQDLSYHPTTIIFATNLNDVRDAILEFPVELRQEG